MRYFDGMKVLADEKKFVTDTNGQRVGVLLDLQTYEHLREAEEELSDIRAYDAARPKVAGELAAGNFTTLARYRARRSSRRS
jgi:PHD/YefM family antitoxin component YafN of YafNO toxin-antitoxin module